MTSADFRLLPDLASRLLSGSVVYANDELFAEKENLIKPTPSAFSPEFGHKGKIYDGWETRRRRGGPERHDQFDHAIVRLGTPGVVHGVVVDTAWFTGNYPPTVSVEGASITGFPSVDELHTVTWTPLVPRSPVQGDTENEFSVTDPHRWTHIRLRIYPDGGVARFRVHGVPVPDPRLLTGTVDLAGVELGGTVVDCSNRFYSSPANLLLPDRPRHMGEGWENSRRRDDGNDHVTVRLGARGVIRRVELDTSWFVGNAPGEAQVRGADLSGLDGPALTAALADPDPGCWRTIVPRTALQIDTRHLFGADSDEPVSHVRVDVYPDGGLARVRVFGEVDPQTMATLHERYEAGRPPGHLRAAATGF
ncbi:allantoicase [Nakamurella leprariae]|uniref:Probable allantoicase n=1 Tax=Nakamurella leprariae TaxID=2803911 RepID=A0A938YHI6_9ACTN|nr:allantoicase [Nakamurella leprariae]MBM9467915.1 allantoicase [Nakamurella leprariae]